MPDSVGVFIDGRYLIQSGVDVLLSDDPHKVMQRIPGRFNVLEFKNAVRSLAERLLPNSRILRIYWYEYEAEDEADEFRRSLVLGKNGMNLRTSVASGDDSDDLTIFDCISSDIERLCNKKAISDALIVSGATDFTEILEETQFSGMRVHFVEVKQREVEETLDLRTKVDTFFTWPANRLERFLLPEDAAAPEDANLVLNPFKYGIPEVQDLIDEIDIKSTEYADEVEAASLAAEDKFEQEDWPEDEFDGLNQGSSEPTQPEELTIDILSQRVRTYSEAMNDSQIKACVQYWSTGRNDVPPLHDKSVLGACREGIQRNLTPDERKIMRDEFMRITNQQFVERNLAVNSQQDSERTFFRRTSPERFQTSPRPRFGRPFQQMLQSEVDEDIKLDITEFVELSVARLAEHELDECVTFWQKGEYGVPAQYDKAVMAVCRQELGRVLTEQEKFFMRAEFKRIANEIAEERGVI